MSGINKMYYNPSNTHFIPFWLLGNNVLIEKSFSLILRQTGVQVKGRED